MEMETGSLSLGAMPGTQQLNRNEGVSREPWKAGPLNLGLSSVCDLRSSKTLLRLDAKFRVFASFPGRGPTSFIGFSKGSVTPERYKPLM